jgi:hypothetical protein
MDARSSSKQKHAGSSAGTVEGTDMDKLAECETVADSGQSDMTDFPEAEVIRRAQQGDPEAFECLYKTAQRPSARNRECEFRAHSLFDPCSDSPRRSQFPQPNLSLVGTYHPTAST